MNFNQYKDVVQDGDLVIIWQGRLSQFCFKVEANQIHQTKYGSLKHNDIIGSTYGSRIKCGVNNKTAKLTGWVYVLQPTLELWTKHLPHRTQILYPTDISIIMFELDITPGKIVCESGTGSGSLSHYLLNGILPGGHLFTYDINEGRCEYAKSEFKSHGYRDEDYTVTCQNICEAGFKLINSHNESKNLFLTLEGDTRGDLNNIPNNTSESNLNVYLPKAEIIILDLPTPWLAIPHAKTILNASGGGRIVSFSPCIEQVQRSTQTMTQNDFCQITTLECVGMTLNVKNIAMPTLDEEESDDRGENSDQLLQRKKSKCSNYTFNTATKPAKLTGHTGYLTFATYFAEWRPSS